MAGDPKRKPAIFFRRRGTAARGGGGPANMTNDRIA